MNKTDVLTALRKTPKGKIKYEPLDNSNIEEFILECNPKPVIRSFLNDSQGNTSSELSFNISSKATSTPNVTPAARSSFTNSNHVTFDTTLQIREFTPSPRESLDVIDMPEETEEEVQCRIEMTKYHLFKQLEQEQQEAESRKVIEAKRLEFEKHAAEMEKRVSELELKRSEGQKLEETRRLKEIDISKRDRNTALELKQKQLLEHQQNHAKRLEEETENVERRRKEYKEEMKRKRKIENQALLDYLKKTDGETVKTIVDIEAKLLSCKNVDQLPPSIRQCQTLIPMIAVKSKQCLQKATEQMEAGVKLSEKFEKSVLELCNQAKNTLEYVTTGVDSVNAKVVSDGTTSGNNDARVTQTVNTTTPSAATTSTTTPAAVHVKTTTTKSANLQPSTVNTQVPKPISIPSNSDICLCVHESSHQRYQQLQRNLQNHVLSYKAFESDSNLKRYRMDLKKAVNIPINAISAQTGDHLKDKQQTLVNLLTGKAVTIGNKHISADQNPAAIAMVKDLFACKIVDQGEVQVLANHEAAFEIAIVMVGVCTVVPDVTPLILAYFHKKCPYTVPNYPPKTADQTSEQYYRSLGYTITDGEVEKQDKFLSRMSGILRLYAAMLVTCSPPSKTPHDNPHPHGVEHAWVWLTSLVNLEPRPSITATVLFDILSVTGHALLVRYGKQYVKLQRMILDVFLPKIKAVTPHGTSGPLTRLEEFLLSCVKSNTVPPPGGLITIDFWKKQSFVSSGRW